MLKWNDLKWPKTLEEAYTLLQRLDHVALAGGTLFHLEKLENVTGVDLQPLLDGPITEEDGRYMIPAMTTLRTLETDSRFSVGPLSILPKAVLHIQGPAFRHIATVGGNVCSRFAKSELITALLALSAQVKLFAGGEISLEEFLATPCERDVLCYVIIPARPGPVGLYALRNGDTEVPLLCAAARRTTEGWRIAMGARPNLAAVRLVPDGTSIAELASRYAPEWDYTSDLQAGGDYRKLAAAAVLRRAMEEALTCS